MIDGHIETAAALLGQHVEESGETDPFLRIMSMRANGCLGLMRISQGRPAEALGFISTALDRAAADGEVNLIAHLLIALSALAATVHRYEEAAQMLGGADRLLEEMHMACPMEPYKWAASETRSKLAAVLSHEAIEHHYRRGRETPTDRTVAAAVELLSRALDAPQPPTI